MEKRRSRTKRLTRLALAGGVLGVAVVGGAGIASARPPASCHDGDVIHIPWDVNWTGGTSCRDVIIGTAGNDHIQAGPNDTVYGEGGDDVIIAWGAGAQLHGGDGDDDLEVPVFQDGQDPMEGSADHAVQAWGDDGDDKLYGGSFDDGLQGGEGDDRLYGGTGSDVLDGGPGDDALFGWKYKGTDQIHAGNDQLYGGPGRDYLYSNDGWADTVDGGSGHDGATFDCDEVDTVSHVEDRNGIGCHVDPSDAPGDLKNPWHPPAGPDDIANPWHPPAGPDDLSDVPPPPPPPGDLANPEPEQVDPPAPTDEQPIAVPAPPEPPQPTDPTSVDDLQALPTPPPPPLPTDGVDDLTDDPTPPAPPADLDDLSAVPTPPGPPAPVDDLTATPKKRTPPAGPKVISNGIHPTH